MATANAVINVAINSSPAAQGLRKIQTQLNAFQSSLNTNNAVQARAAKNLAAGLSELVNSSQFFTAETVRMRTAASQLDQTLSKGRGTMRDYISARFIKNSAQAASMLSLANQRAAALETQFHATGGAANGFREALAIRPITAFNSATAVSAQRLAIQRAMLMQATTSMINFGKNTQWAGRQLMVGFTIPLTIFAGMSGKAFREIEKEAVNFKKVYGDAFTPPAEMEQNLKAVQDLAREYTKYGIAVKDTINLAAQAAATGAQNADLIDATRESTRLATLGQMDQNKALETTIALQTAFNISGQDLSKTINFLNMVENQTVVTLQDLAEAIPRVAPVIKGLGGTVEDMAVFLAAMREGGITAAQGANALKSGLASLINPTDRAVEKLGKMGVNMNQIVQMNRGDLMGTVKAFGTALASLDEFSRQQALETVFGKFQYARLGALFNNIVKDGSQASRVMDTAAMSAQQLAASAEKELGAIEQSAATQFTAAMEKLKLAIAPIGEMFTKMAIPVLQFLGKIADAFNNLPDPAKKFAGFAAVLVGIVIPVGTMFLGLLMNLVGTLVKFGTIVGLAFKGFASGGLKGAIKNVSQALNYMSLAEIDAATAAQQLGQSAEFVNQALLEQPGLSKAAEAGIRQLGGAYEIAAMQMREAALASRMAFGTPGAAMGLAGRGGQSLVRMPLPIVKRNAGGTIPGSGSTDTVPAMLTPGEFVVNKKATQKNLGLLKEINDSGKAGGSVSAERGMYGFFPNVSRLSPAAQDMLARTQAFREASASIPMAPARRMTASPVSQREKSFAKSRSRQLYDTLAARYPQESQQNKVAALRIATERLGISPDDLGLTTRGNYIFRMSRDVNLGMGRGNLERQKLLDDLMVPDVYNPLERQMTSYFGRGLNQNMFDRIFRSEISKLPENGITNKLFEKASRNSLTKYLKEAGIPKRDRKSFMKDLLTGDMVNANLSKPLLIQALRRNNIQFREGRDPKDVYAMIDGREVNMGWLLGREIASIGRPENILSFKSLSGSGQAVHANKGGLIPTQFLRFGGGIRPVKPTVKASAPQPQVIKLGGRRVAAHASSGVTLEDAAALTFLGPAERKFYEAAMKNPANRSKMRAEGKDFRLLNIDYVYNNLFRSGGGGLKSKENIKDFAKYIKSSPVEELFTENPVSRLLPRTQQRLRDRLASEISKMKTVPFGDAEFAQAYDRAVSSVRTDLGKLKSKGILEDFDAAIRDSKTLREARLNISKPEGNLPIRTGITDAINRLSPDEITSIKNGNPYWYTRRRSETSSSKSTALIWDGSKFVSVTTGSMRKINAEQRAIAQSQYPDMFMANKGGKVPGMRGGGMFLGNIHSFSAVQKARQAQTVAAQRRMDILENSDRILRSGKYSKIKEIQLGKKIGRIGGRSSELGLNGIYNIDGKPMVAKIHDDPASALLEEKMAHMSGAFGLKSPQQRAVRVKDPKTGKMVMAVISPYDPAIANPVGRVGRRDLGNQIVGGLYRRENDAQQGNVDMNRVNDVGRARYGTKASTNRQIKDPESVGDFIDTFFLRRKGGAKKWLMESTADLAKKMSADQYESMIRTSIEGARKRAKQYTDTLPNASDKEKAKWLKDITSDLDEMSRVDWRELHTWHSSIKPGKVAPKKTKADAGHNESLKTFFARFGGMIPQMRNKGGEIFESAKKTIVPGVGNTDTVPAALTPGEFVVNKQATKENLGLLHAINSGKALGFNKGGKIPGVQYFGRNMLQRIVQSRKPSAPSTSPQQQKSLERKLATWLGGGMNKVNVRELAKLGLAKTHPETELFRGMVLRPREGGRARFAPEVHDAFYKYARTGNPEELAGILGKPIAIGARSFSKSKRVTKEFSEVSSSNTEGASFTFKIKDEKGIYGIDPYQKIGARTQSSSYKENKRSYKKEKEIIPLGKPEKGRPDVVVGRITLDKDGMIVIDAGAKLSRKEISSVTKEYDEMLAARKTPRDQFIQAEREVQRLQSEYLKIKTKGELATSKEAGNLYAKITELETRLLGQNFLPGTQRDKRTLERTAKIMKSLKQELPTIFNRAQALGRNSGGTIPGVGNTDTVPAMLTPGEFVVNKKATSQHIDLLDAINSGNVKKLAFGGPPDEKEATRQRRFLRRLSGTGGRRGESGIIGNRSFPVGSLIPGNAAQVGATAATANATSRGSVARNVAPSRNILGYDANGKAITSPRMAVKLFDAGGLFAETAQKRGRTVGAQRITQRETFMSRLGQRVRNAEGFYNRNSQIAKSQRQRERDQRREERRLARQQRVQKIVTRVAAPAMIAASSLTARSPIARPGGGAAQQFRDTRRPKGFAGNQRIVTGDYNEKTVRRMQSALGSQGIRTTPSQANDVLRQGYKIGDVRRGVIPPGYTPAGPAGSFKNLTPRPQSSQPARERSSRIGRMGQGLLGKFAPKPKVGLTDEQKQQKKDARKQRAAAARMGIGSALMMGSMVPALAADEEGKFMGMDSMTAMMGMMGAGTLLTLPPKIALFAAAIAAAGIALYKLRDSVDTAAREGAKMGSNMGGAANRMEALTEATGYQFATQRVGDQQFRFTDKERAAASEFSPYFESEQGTKFIKDLKDLSRKDRYEKVASIIAQGVADGMDPKKAKAYGDAIAYYANDALLRQRLFADFKSGKFQSGTEALVGLLEKRAVAADGLGTNSLRDIGLSAGTKGVADFFNIGNKDRATAVWGQAVGETGATAALGAGIGTAIGIIGGPPGMAAGAVLGAIAGTLVGGYVSWQKAQEQMRKLNENVGQAAQTWGSSIQILKEAQNAEAALIEARRNGTITEKQFEDQMARVRDVQEQAAQSFEGVVDAYMTGGQLDEGALKQALKDQLVLQGFEGDLAEAVVNTVSFNEIAKSMFPGFTPEEVAADANMSAVVKEVMVQTLGGITPENAQQRISDVRDQWARVSQDLLNAAKDGLLSSADARDALAGAAAADSARTAMQNAAMAGGETVYTTEEVKSDPAMTKDVVERALRGEKKTREVKVPGAKGRGTRTKTEEYYVDPETGVEVSAKSKKVPIATQAADLGYTLSDQADAGSAAGFYEFAEKTGQNVVDVLAQTFNENPDKLLLWKDAVTNPAVAQEIYGALFPGESFEAAKEKMNSVFEYAQSESYNYDLTTPIDRAAESFGQMVTENSDAIGKMGMNVSEVEAAFAGLTDLSLMQNIAEDEAAFMRFAETVKLLGMPEYSGIDLTTAFNFATENNLDTKGLQKTLDDGKKIVQDGVKSIANEYKGLGKQAVKNIESGMPSPAEFNDLMMQANIDPSEWDARFKEMTDISAKFWKKYAKDVNKKTGTIKVTADIVTNVLGTELGNPQEVADSLNAFFPDGINPAYFPIIAYLVNETELSLPELAEAKGLLEADATASSVTLESGKVVERSTLDTFNAGLSLSGAASSGFTPPTKPQNTSGSGSGQKSIGQQLSEQLKEVKQFYKNLEKFMDGAQAKKFKQFIAGPFAPEFLDYLLQQGEQGVKLMNKGIEAVKKEYEKFKQIKILETLNASRLAPFMRNESVNQTLRQTEQATRLASQGLGQAEIDFVMESIPQETFDVLDILQTEMDKLKRKKALGTISKEELARLKEVRQQIAIINRDIENAKRNAKKIKFAEELQGAVDAITGQREEIENFSGFISAGLDVDTTNIFGDLGISFDTFAAAGKKGQETIAKLIEAAKAARKALSFKEVISNLEDMRREIQVTSNITAAGFTGEFADELKGLGIDASWTAQEIRTAANALTMLKASQMLARTETQKLTDTLNLQQSALQAQIDNYQRMKIKPLEDQLDALNAQLDGENDLIEAQQRRIATKQRDIEMERRLKEPIEERIDKLNEEQDELQKAHDERIKALEKVENINKRIADQQQGQLDVASALSSGDIAGAAKAALDLQRNLAQGRIQEARDAIQAQFDNERQAIEDKILTARKEIEAVDERIKTIEMDIRDIQDDIYNKETLRLKVQDDIAKKQKEIQDAQKGQLDLEEKMYKLQLLSSMLQTKQAILDAARIGDKEAVGFNQQILKSQLTVGGADQAAQEAFFNQVGQRGVVQDIYGSGVMGDPDAIVSQAKAEIGITVDGLRQFIMSTFSVEEASAEGFPGALQQLVLGAHNTAEEFKNPVTGLPYTTGSIISIMKEHAADKLQSFFDGQFNDSIKGMGNTMVSLSEKMVGIGSIVDDIVEGFRNIRRRINEKIESAKDAIASLHSKIIEANNTRIQTTVVAAPHEHMYGGVVKRAFGGAINFKGSREPAPGMMYGGKMKKYAYGSFVPGIGMTDKVPALLTPGEFVVRKSVAAEYGPLLTAINSNVFPKMGGSSIMPSSDSSKQSKDGIQYNYQVNVNVAGTNASPDDIANTVMYKIKRFDDRQIKGVKVG